MHPGEPRQDAAARAATFVREASGATVGVALVGTAGLDEGVFGAAPGETWLGVASQAGVQTQRIAFGGQDEYTVVRLGNEALRRIAEEVG